MDSNVGPVDVFFNTKLVYVATLLLTCVSSGCIVALSRHWLCLCIFWPLILHCCEKVTKCCDIHAAFMFPFFLVSLSQQY